MVDRLHLLAAVNMLPAPSTQGVAQRLAVSKEVAESALHEAEEFQLVAEGQSAMRASSAGTRQMWRLSEAGRSEMYRLLHSD